VGAQDWGVGHYNAAYLFTKALVRTIVMSTKRRPYASQKPCFKVEKRTKNGQRYSNACVNCPTVNQQFQIDILFSRKFSKQVTGHTPADEYSVELRALGLPPVTRAAAAAGDRVGSASMVYNMLSNGELVILDTCRISSTRFLH